MTTNVLIDWTTKELRREAVRLGVPGAETADRERLVEELEECLGGEARGLFNED